MDLKSNPDYVNLSSVSTDIFSERQKNASLMNVIDDVNTDVSTESKWLRYILLGVIAVSVTFLLIKILKIIGD